MKLIIIRIILALVNAYQLYKLGILISLFKPNYNVFVVNVLADDRHAGYPPGLPMILYLAILTRDESGPELFKWLMYL